jgi:hypothetical protein
MVTKMNEDHIDSFVLELTEFLNKMLPPEKNMGDFFDTDDNYNPVLEFVHDKLDRYCSP